jgi:hypothetical protein
MCSHSKNMNKLSRVLPTSELVWLQHVICVILLNPQVDLLSTRAMGPRLLLAAVQSQITTEVAQWNRRQQVPSVALQFAVHSAWPSNYALAVVG